MTTNAVTPNVEVTPAKKATKSAKKAAKKVVAKKAVAKKAPVKNEEKGPRGHRYFISNKGNIREKLSPQGVFIIEELKSAGKTGLTKAELVSRAIKAGQKGFPTNQPHDRAIGFYLSQFKNEEALDFAK